MTRSSSKVLLKLTKELDKVSELKVYQAGSRVTAVSSCSGGPTTIFASLNSYVWVVYRLQNHQFGEAKKTQCFINQPSYLDCIHFVAA
jgi:hypothetical protein